MNKQLLNDLREISDMADVEPPAERATEAATPAPKTVEFDGISQAPAAAAPTIDTLPQPLLYYRADDEGNIVWGEDCVCVDDVYSTGRDEDDAEFGETGCKAFSEKQMRAAILRARKEGEEAGRKAAEAELVDTRKAYVTQCARLASAGAGINQEQINQIAEGWDGCMYDGVGEIIDIGASLRRAFAALARTTNEGKQNG